MRKLLLFVALLLCSNLIFAQSAGDYQSNFTGGGNWNVNTTWEIYNGSAWVTPPSGTYPDDTDGVITIMEDDIVTIPNGVTILADEIYVDLYGTLEIASGGTLDLQDGPGDDLIIYNDFFDLAFFDVYGRFEISNGATAVEDDFGTPNPLSDFTTMYYDGSVVELKYTTTAGVVPGGSWETGSTMEITGYTTNRNAPTGLDQSFYNFTWNCPGQRRSIDLDGALTDVDGDLTISNTGGTRALALTRTSGPYICNIAGDLIVTGASNLIGGTSATATYNIGGDFIYSASGTNSYVGTNGTPTLNITGNLSITNGEIAIPTGNGNATINLDGDFSIGSAGELTTGNSPGTFNFTGSATQNVSITGTNSGEFDYYILSGSTVDLGTSYLSGDGTFNLNSGGKILLGSTDASGAIQSGTTAGNIRVAGTRTYSTGSTIEYNGSAAQTLGTGYPLTGQSNLIINNVNGVTANASPTIDATATLNLLSGNLTIGSFQTLTINGSLTGTGTFIGGAAASMAIGGSGDLGTVTFSSQLQLANLTLNRSGSPGGFSLGSNLAVESFTQTLGDIDLNGFTLDLTGDYTRTSGSINSNSASGLLFTDSGTMPASIPLTGGAINILTMDRVGSTLTLPSTITITNLNLLNGSLDNTGSLTITTDGTITRISGTMTSSPINSAPGEAYNIIYNPGSNTFSGPEFSLNVNAVGNVTKNGLGTLFLSDNYTINGSLALNDGNFGLGNFTLTLEGDLISNAASSLTAGRVIFDGTSVVSGSTTVSMADVEFTSSSTVTFPSSNLNIRGDIQFFSGATFNANNGTVTLNASADQLIAAAGSTFNNITINKGGGAVTLTNLFNLTGALEFVTGTTLNSNGNLTLLSTSDGPTGNARIGIIPSGAAVNGNVIIQRYMGAEGQNVWRHISSFVSGATINDLLDDFTLPQPMYYYDETIPGSFNDRWVPVSAPSTPLTVGLGYIAPIFAPAVPTIWDLTGPIITGTVNFTVSRSGPSDDDGWNLLGNPYPSTINWDILAGWSKSNISSTVYVRDYAAGTWRYWNGVDGDLNNGLIASGQAFFVYADAASASISINENAKSTSTGAFYRIQEEEVFNRLIVGLSDGTRLDKTFIRFKEDAQTVYDRSYDGYKLANDTLNLASVLESGSRMCINYLPIPDEFTEVKLDIYSLHNGQYSLSFEDLETFEGRYDLILVDAYKNIEINLNDIVEYNFNVNLNEALSYGSDRFKIVFQNSVTGFDIDEVKDQLIVYPNPASNFANIEFNNTIIGEGESVKLQIFNIADSKLVLEEEMINFGNNYQLNLNISKFDRGVYLVVINADDNKYYTKFVKH